MVHQTLLLNCLDHTGMEYVLPNSFVNPFFCRLFSILSSQTLMLCIQTMSLDSVQLNHFVCMQNSTEVLCEVFISVTQGFIYFYTM